MSTPIPVPPARSLPSTSSRMICLQAVWASSAPSAPATRSAAWSFASAEPPHRNPPWQPWRVRRFLPAATATARLAAAAYIFELLKVPLSSNLHITASPLSYALSIIAPVETKTTTSTPDRTTSYIPEGAFHDEKEVDCDCCWCCGCHAG